MVHLKVLICLAITMQTVYGCQKDRDCIFIHKELGYVCRNEKCEKPTTTTLGEKPTPACIETGHHWMGGDKLVAEEMETDTPSECQEKCRLANECNWFTWGDERKPKGCWLLNQKGDHKDVNHGRTAGATGPKNCGKCKTVGGTDCVFPFTYDGRTFNSCALDKVLSKPWCATAVDSNGNYVNYSNDYDWCPESCPQAPLSSVCEDTSGANFCSKAIMFQGECISSCL